VPLVPLAAAALLAQAAAAQPPASQGGQPPVHVEAPEASWDVGAGEALLQGGVLLQRGSLRLRAPSARYRPASRQVEISGGVLLVDGPRAVVAKALRGEVGGVYEAEEPAVFFVDDPAALSEAKTPEEAERVTRRRLTLHASRATGSADGTLRLEGARATMCACPDGCAPSWELRARSADVRPGERAILTWPVLWITPRFLWVERPVPVLALPWLYVPLGERQTGLLLPELQRSGSLGVTVAEPLFVTLGQSADATLWGGWAFGGTEVRGFVGALELRWAPAVLAEGKLRIDYVHDLQAEAGGTHGARVAVNGLHAQRIGERTDLRIELELAGDSLYARDFTSDLLSRGATYQRSALLLSTRREDAVMEGSASWLLPLADDGSLARASDLSWGLFGAGLPTFHRGPSLAGLLLPSPIPGGLLASGRVEVARFGPLSGITSDAGVDGIGAGDLAVRAGAVERWDPAAPDAGQLDGSFDPGERLAATRGSVRAELSYPVAVGEWLRVAPFVRGAASGYAFDAEVAPIANAWATAGATAETELSRRFGSLRHAFVPRLALRVGTRVAGEPLPGFAFDGWDRAEAVPPGAAATFDAPRLVSSAPPGPFQQGRASLETRLDGVAGSLLRLELGQDVDLRSGELAESFATARAKAGPLTAEGVARYAGFATRPRGETPSAIAADDWAELRGSLRLASARGHDLHASLRSVGAGGSASEQAGVDALFDLRPSTLPMSSQASLGFRLPIGPATLGYDVLFPGREVTVRGCDATEAGDRRRLGALHVQQHAASFVWDSPCKCFRLSAQVKLNDCDGFDPRDATFKVAIDLSPGEPVGALR
jgi:LPS-assembly protein